MDTSGEHGYLQVKISRSAESAELDGSLGEHVVLTQLCVFSGCMSVGRGVAAIGLAVRTGWSREESGSASRSSRPTTVAGVYVAVMT